MKIRVGLTKTPKAKPAPGQKLGFGRIFSDHMFVMKYKTGKGWYDPRIVPYGELSLSPAAMCLHYGQTVFEGMKAYYGKDGNTGRRGRSASSAPTRTLPGSTTPTGGSPSPTSTRNSAWRG